MYVHSTFCYVNFFSASGEAILGTQRYFCIAQEPHTAKLQSNRFFTKKSFKNEGLAVFCPKNNLFLKAIFKNNTFLNVFSHIFEQHFTQALYQSTLSKHFTQSVDQSTLHKHFIKALYTISWSKHFTQALYQSTLHKHFIKALYQGISKQF